MPDEVFCRKNRVGLSKLSSTYFKMQYFVVISCTLLVVFLAVVFTAEVRCVQ